MPLSSADLTESCRNALFAEVLHPHDGGVSCDVAMPLRWGDRPVLALTYDREDLAQRLSEAPQATLVLSDSRMALKGWEPIAAAVRMEVVEDPDGARFELDGLLGQELIKYTPARHLADTPLLRREYWWYMPRLLVSVAEVASVWPVGRRTGDDAVLAVRRGGAGGPTIDADTVAVEDWEADPIVLRSLVGRSLGEMDADTATLFCHDFAVPELDRHTHAAVTGRLADGRLRVHERFGARELQRPLGLLRRLRRVRDLERACRAGLERRGVQPD